MTLLICFVILKYCTMIVASVSHICLTLQKLNCWQTCLWLIYYKYTRITWDACACVNQSTESNVRPKMLLRWRWLSDGRKTTVQKKQKNRCEAVATPLSTRQLSSLVWNCHMYHICSLYSIMVSEYISSF